MILRAKCVFLHILALLRSLLNLASSMICGGMQPCSRCMERVFPPASDLFADVYARVAPQAAILHGALGRGWGTPAGEAARSRGDGEMLA